MAVTIRDVARRCGLSVATVSKALNQYSDVNPATRERVRHTAREMGYRANPMARALKTRHQRRLGLLIADESGSALLRPLEARIIDSFRREAEWRGYDLSFISHNIGAMPLSFLEHCRDRNVAGLCLSSLDFYAPEVVELVASPLPLVTIDHVFYGRPCVLSDNQKGMRDLVRLFYARGHRRIAYVHGPRSAVTDFRLTSFHRTLSELGLSAPGEYLVPCAAGDIRGAKEAVLGLLALPQPPTGILMPDDRSALGALEAARARSLRVPEDLSIAGYGGEEWMQQLAPRLTTVAQDADRMGSMAADVLIRAIEHPQTAGADIYVADATLLPGETVAFTGTGRKEASSE